MAWLAWGFHMSAMAARCEAYSDKLAAEGRFHTIGEHILGTKSLWDLFCCGIVTWIWLMMLQPIRYLLNTYILPEELQFYASAIPIFNLGRNGEYGVAAYYAPPRNTSKQAPEKDVVEPAPQHYVCNIGHISTMHNGGMEDLSMTMNTLRDVWREFRKPDLKGFVANIVCIFPNLNDAHIAKEINLSCWETAEDARRWYSTSSGHRDIMRRHNGGQLRTFGSLLATLEPHGPIRHQDRCVDCKRLVEADIVGEKAPTRCKVCKGKTHEYPWF